MYIYIYPKYISILLESIRCFREATRSLRPPNLSLSVRVCRSSTWTRRTWKRLESPEISASRRRMWCLVKICAKKTVDDLWWLWWSAWSIFLWFLMGKSNQWLHADKPDKLMGWFRKAFIFPDVFFVKYCGYGSWHGWVQVNIVPYRGQELDQWNFRTPSSVEKNVRNAPFPTDYPGKQQVGQFETQVTGKLIPWVLGCGTWICQVVNHLPTFRWHVGIP